MARRNHIEMVKPRLILPVGYKELNSLKITNKIKVTKVQHQGENRIMFVLPDFGTAWLVTSTDELRRLSAAIDDLLDEYEY